MFCYTLYMKMKLLQKVDLPRERLERYGPKKLKDHELLAILLGSGVEGVNVLELSRRILKVVEQKGRQNVSKEDLKDIKGLGKAKISLILSLIELADRFSRNDNREILSPKDVWNSCADFRESKREHFVAFYFDTQNRLIERRIISVGTLDSSLVHPREVFEPALALSAASIIVTHNHPSGSVEPSFEDKEVTRRLVEAGDLLGIQIIDHLIITTKTCKGLLRT